MSSTGNPGSKYTLTFWADGNVQNYRIASSNGKLVVKQVEYDNLKDLIKNFQVCSIFIIIIIICYDIVCVFQETPL